MPGFRQIIIGVAATVIVAMPGTALAATDASAGSAAQKGIQYLAAHQGSDGSISGFGGETEWTAVAVKAAGQDPATFTNGGASMVDFLKGDSASATSPTAIERKIIAISATGQDASNFGGTNYVALLEAQHTGGQIGDPTLLNDDIFGIIAADASGSPALVPVAQDALDYLLAHQAADGGFSYDASGASGSDSNDTAAAIIAMYAAQHMNLTASNLADSESEALTYLLSDQQADGGFSYDAFSPSDGGSTAWSLMALNSVGSFVSSQINQARDWLLQNQNSDGGFSYGAYGYTDSDTYTTSHAVTALLGTTWLLRPTPFKVTTDQPQAPASQTTPASTPSSPPATPKPAVVTTVSSTSTPASNQTASDTTIAGDSTTTPDNSSPGTKTDVSKPQSSPVKKAAPKSPYVIYGGAALLGLVAVIWFLI